VLWMESILRRTNSGDVPIDLLWKDPFPQAWYVVQRVGTSFADI
jgi:hypothetical protein